MIFSETQANISRAEPGTALGVPGLMLRAEGAALLAAAFTFYALTGGNWLLFAVLFLAPDLFMLGYFIDTRIGAAVYNLGHTTVVPLALIALGFSVTFPLLISVALIWLGHIGFDRVLGYGLKYGDAFKHTHLGAPFVRG